MRGKWQRDSVERKRATVQRNTIMIVVDYVMKLLPMRSIESSKCLFGKSGMVDLGALLSWKGNSETLENHYVDMIIDDGDGEQDVSLSAPLLEALLDHV